MTQSNLLGRALEYIVVEKLYSTFVKRGLVLTPKTILAQQRDVSKFDGLSELEKEEYIVYSGLILKWLDDKFFISKAKKIVVDRVTDAEAIAGDVTDIRINIDENDINLSIKHNHFALKHQRPPRLAVQCGFIKGGDEDFLFRKALNKIYLVFHSESKKVATDKVNSFKKLKIIDPDFIENNLYLPVCLEVVDFINKYASNEFLAKSLFSFLVGNKNFYKIVASKNAIEIKEFANIPLPQKVEAKLIGKSYVNLIFSNGWIINMRLHTASTLVTSVPSLKFDTQAVKIEIPEIIITDSH